MRILIAEDDLTSRKVLESTLLKWGHEVTPTSNGSEAWTILQQESAPSLAILDWMMPELDGLEVCRRVRLKKSPTPPYIILLTSMSEKQNVVAGLESGADDYLTKPFNREELYARLQVGERIIELQGSLAARVRQLESAEAELRELSLTDELTGLFNRRGFLMHAEQHLKTARRTGQNSLLIYADMDGLKRINDTLGHAEGSRAIAEMAEVLRRTFRDSDIISRLGGDEFTVLGVSSSPGDADRVTARLQEVLRERNGRRDREYELSLSFGIVCIDPRKNITTDELIAAADQSMYEQKRKKKEAGVQK
jgi:two-component system, cell cycle response regulator